MRRYIMAGLVLGIAMMLLVPVTSAQSDENILSYGDVVEGIMQVGESEVEYQFEAQGGDILVIEVSTPIDSLSGLFPELALLNESGSTIAETSFINEDLENSDMFASQIVLQIPADGIYTILVIEGDFSVMQQDAAFKLRLLQPEILELDTTVEGTANSLEPSYYILISSDAFVVDFNHSGDNYYPALYIGSVGQGAAEPLGSLYGKGITGGSIKITPNRNSVHLITVARSAFDLTNLFQSLSVNFDLTVVRP